MPSAEAEPRKQFDALINRSAHAAARRGRDALAEYDQGDGRPDAFSGLAAGTVVRRRAGRRADSRAAAKEMDSERRFFVFRAARNFMPPPLKFLQALKPFEA